MYSSIYKVMMSLYNEYNEALLTTLHDGIILILASSGHTAG